MKPYLLKTEGLCLIRLSLSYILSSGTFSCNKKTKTRKGGHTFHCTVDIYGVQKVALIQFYISKIKSVRLREDHLLHVPSQSNNATHVVPDLSLSSPH